MKIFFISIILLYASGCGIINPRPVEPVIITETFCPSIPKLNRPTPIGVDLPVFLVVLEGDPRLKDGALIALTPEGYEELSDLIESVIIYSSQCTSALEYYESAIDRLGDNSGRD